MEAYTNEFVIDQLQYHKIFKRYIIYYMYNVLGRLLRERRS